MATRSAPAAAPVLPVPPTSAEPVPATAARAASAQADPASVASQAARAAAERLDGRLHAALAPLTAGLSPVALALAWADWSLQLASQPAQATRLAARAGEGWLRWAGETGGQVPPNGDDTRFAHPAWQAWPWAPVVHAWHAVEDWWTDATTLRGMSPHHSEMTRFFARQWLDMLSPANRALASPEVLQRARETGGASLAQGALHALDSWRSRQGLPPLQPPEALYRPGVEVAVTPGRVVHRNALVELIQYTPTTATVQAEPVFIVPSWIMKYYILDLSPHNSLVRWLVDQGHTVFILSWRNPDASDALLDMADYLDLGIFDTLAAIGRAVPGQAVHACGYCLGGTLLALAAAALARPAGVPGAEHLPALQSVSLLAAETDFSEPGEMGVLIDEAQVAWLEDLMAERGYLSGAQMAGSFGYLHSRELVWSQANRAYWLGEPTVPNDLMAWNADTTRMPAAMHSEYLRRCYLRNEIAEGRFPVHGAPVALSDIVAPMFVVGTERDHVSPWKSVYKIHRLADTAVTFVLANGGHNAGIVSEPGHAGRRYAMATRPAGGAWVPPEAWGDGATRHLGSWWTAWHDWLQAHGSGQVVPARRPTVDDELGPAPGRHVHIVWRD